MKRAVGFTALGLALAIGVAACGPRTTPTAEPPKLATVSPPASYTPQPVLPMPTERPMQTPPPGHIPPQEDLVVDQVVADLAARLEIASSAVQVVQVNSVVWSDASLGCPRPGMMYVQVVTEGYRITLEAEGDPYEYHTDQRGFFVLCEDGEPVRAAPNGPETPMTNDQLDQAKADLAGRLDIDPQDIEVVSVEEVTWRDGSLGCPQPGMAYTQALVNGSRIILGAEGRQWHYHSGGGREPFLCLMPQDPLSSGNDEPGGGFGDY